jgi:transmembrane sensor
MDRIAFHNLLKKYVDGTSSDEEQRIIDHWYSLLDNPSSRSIADSELSEVESRLWNSIQNETINVSLINDALQKRPPVYYVLKYASIAAVLTALLVGFYFYDGRRQTTAPDRNYTDIINQSNKGAKCIQVKLDDGSEVLLYPQSKISYPKHFLKNKREVFLEGEAFFEVTKNLNRPFFVYNNNLVTEVLGTSFNIKIINNKIEVAVKTGRVAVFENGQQFNLNANDKIQNGVIITPNQKVTYYEENKHFVTALVDTPMPVAQPTDAKQEDAKFVFDDSPLSDVLKSIEKTYQIEIVLENENLNNCPFTGDITKQDLFKKLSVICQAFQASYEIEGTKILIKNGNGCN